MSESIHLRHLCFTGSHKESAIIDFVQGLNLLYGASDTGKSFVLESIKYMLGGSKLRDIPERLGYDNVFLGIETSDGEEFTLRRSTNGGDYHLYTGLHKSIPEGIETETIYRMDAKKSPKISEFIFNKVGLSGKKLKKNQLFETVNLNLSHFFNLCIIDEKTIYRQSSVIERDNYITRTEDQSLFRFLLTGNDDSSLIPYVSPKDRALSRAAKLEVIDALVEKNSQCIDEAGISYKDATDQLDNLQKTIEREEKQLASSSVKYKELIKERNLLRSEQNKNIERRQEIDGVIQRFQLLDKHYESDLERLDSICEAGTLMHMLPNSYCPHCGALPNEQVHSKTCAVNIVPTVEAAVAEKNKILQLKSELSQTICDLRSEALYVENIIPEINNKLNSLDAEVEEISPIIKESSVTFSELLEKRTFIREIISAYEQISILNDMKKDVEAEAKTKSKKPQNEDEATLPQSLLDKLAKQIEAILKAWEFPDADRVFFDTKTNDLTISGKCRKDRGKGMRSVIHAAFNIGLLEFCKKNNRPHLGIVILDSPLLAYKEPDNDSDSLCGTSVQDKFYEYLLTIKDRQIIIIENVDPPTAMLDQPCTVHFSKNESSGRYGFFPPTTHVVD
ncbi:ATP-binding protein [Desulfovibrio litoralis]|uniref:Rad50/SbcC-type AAA domain-containing protein n=1 Tax=Desulfovibrio litoralis DSM 11393 TaxID=1121455 RepID=A0A1M7TNU1_9BACT|nr:ATP-binding protein [Desulfovibrio litoralis]SHN72375.1 hypothetical protein SAMN02745728_02308 [Desulfovibrio litoralis DSM 11393]